MGTEAELRGDYAQGSALALVTVVLVSLLSVSVALYRSKRQTGPNGALKLPPGPPNLPVIGSMHLLSDPLSLAFQELSRKYGPLMHMRLGFTDCVVVSDADTAKAFTTTHDVQFASRPYTTLGKVAGFNFNDIALSPASPHQKRLRKLMATEIMSAERIASFEPIIAEETAACVTRMLDSNPDPVPFRRELKAFASNVMCRILFGRRYAADSAMGKSLQAFADAVERVGRIGWKMDPGQFFPALRWMDLVGVERSMMKVMIVVEGSLQALLDDRRLVTGAQARADADADGNTDMDLLRAARKNRCTMADILLWENQAGRLSDIELKAAVFNTYAGAVETSATTVEWGIAELLNNPDMLNRVRQELDRVVGEHRCVQENDLSNLPFLQAVVKETLRLHPPLPLSIPHYNEEAAEVNGYYIPAKTTVFFNLHAVNRDSRKWDLPDQFQPDRFLNSNINVLGAHHQVLPFGAGRRMCPGVPLGLATTVRALAAVIHALDFQLLGEDGSIQAAGTQAQGTIDLSVATGSFGYMKQPVRAVSLPRLVANVYRN